MSDENQVEETTPAEEQEEAVEAAAAMEATESPEPAAAPLAPEEPCEPIGARSLDLLMDVPLQVTVELGRKRMRISELLALSKGSVVELDKVAGQPLDVRVNDQLVARGEAVVINDKFGVRLTDVVQAAERVSSLA